ncbi:MAG: hypothetical protein P1P84_06485 [Deferrisomatales bacterium]|nr:hypothetical protein [Deferrisomatales bacterium]
MHRCVTLIPVLRAATLAVLVGLGSFGCGSDDYSSGGSGSGGTITVELSGDPIVKWDADRQATTVEVQFIARGASGVPLSPADMVVDMEINGQSVSENPLNESVFIEDSENLAASISYGLVLDASLSMTKQQPEAFGPMREAARDSIVQGLDLWRDRPAGSSFFWEVTWFNGFLYRQEGLWVPDHVTAIPTPNSDQFEEGLTKLYAAVESTAKKMKSDYDNGIAAGARDHHIMVVLSDGVDNRSHTPTANIELQHRVLTAQQVNGSYTRFGWEETDLDKAIEAVAAHPRLTVHALAVGTDFGKDNKGIDDLKKIAAAGRGRFQQNPSSAIADLFDQVTREFTTLQTRRATISQADGEYRFRLVVRGADGSGPASKEFRYRAGTQAQFLGTL